MARKSTPANVGMLSQADMRKFEVEDALHVMKRAEEIKRNAPLMRDVKKLAKEHQTMLGRITTGSTKPRTK